MNTIQSPFLNEMENSLAQELENNATIVSENYASNSPFISNYEQLISDEFENEDNTKANHYYEMLEELHDREFESATENMILEMQEHLSSYESSGTFMNNENREQLVLNYLAPVIQEANSMVSNLEAELELLPVNELNEMEFEVLLNETLEKRETYGTPAQEFFLKKFANKVKAVVKKVKSVAKKLMPHKLILEKIKKLIAPLLKKILERILNKMPNQKKLRGPIIELAKKFLNIDLDENSEEPGDESSNEGGDENPTGGMEENGDTEFETVITSETIQNELDHYMAGLIASDSELEMEQLANEYEQNTSQNEIFDLKELEDARENFIQELENLKEGEDPTPVFENFIPAILKAARIALGFAIKAMGREKAVNLLAGLMAKFIGKFLSQDNAKNLSVFLADKGLKLFKLESSDQNNQRAVYEAIANTVQEATLNIGKLNSEVFRNNELLAHESYMALEKAAASYFPDNIIRKELRESETADGRWVNKGKYFKHSKTFSVDLSPIQLNSIKVFGGVSLAQFIRDSLGLNSTSNLQATVHLFEIKLGGTLSWLALNEKNIPGLGTASRASYNQILPLDQKNASILLGQPGLGSKTPSRFLQSVHKVHDKQRFFFLEIEKAKQQTTTTPLINQAIDNGSSNPNSVVDITPIKKSTQFSIAFGGSLSQGLIVKTRIFFSEKDAVIILEGTQSNNFSQLYEFIKRLVPASSRNYFSDKNKLGNIILKSLFVAAGNIVKEKIAQSVINEIKGRIVDFENAVKDPKDGVTISVQFSFSFDRSKKFKIKLKEAVQNSSMGIYAGFQQGYIASNIQSMKVNMNKIKDLRASNATQFAKNNNTIAIQKPLYN